MGAFAHGQYVELLTTVQTLSGASVETGTRGRVQQVDAEGRCLVEFLSSERFTGERAWVQAIDLLAA